MSRDQFTCVFAAGRMAGWCAHILEQSQENQLIRPQANYIGPEVHPFEPINHRIEIRPNQNAPAKAPK